MSTPLHDPSYGPLRPKRQRASAILHLQEQEDGTVKVVALHSPPIPLAADHQLGTVETIASKMLRAAIEAGAKED
jgi:hypothetical protein